MKFFCDTKRHLVCMPFSEENLHVMAKKLGIKRNWFHRSRNGLCHYDIPKRRMHEIAEQCTVVNPVTIVFICKGLVNPYWDSVKENWNRDRAEQDLSREKRRRSSQSPLAKTPLHPVS